MLNTCCYARACQRLAKINGENKNNNNINKQILQRTIRTELRDIIKIRTWRCRFAFWQKKFLTLFVFVLF